MGSKKKEKKNDKKNEKKKNQNGGDKLKEKIKINDLKKIYNINYKNKDILNNNF